MKKEEIDESEITCYNVDTYYKSGRVRSEIIAAKDEETMWKIYDRRHRKKELINGSAITDCWGQ